MLNRMLQRGGVGKMCLFFFAQLKDAERNRKWFFPCLSNMNLVWKGDIFSRCLDTVSTFLFISTLQPFVYHSTFFDIDSQHLKQKIADSQAPHPESLPNEAHIFIFRRGLPWVEILARKMVENPPLVFN